MGVGVCREQGSGRVLDLRVWVNQGDVVEGWGACERAVWGVGERAGMRVGALDLGSGWAESDLVLLLISDAAQVMIVEMMLELLEMNVCWSLCICSFYGLQKELRC